MMTPLVVLMLASALILKELRMKKQFKTQLRLKKGDPCYLHQRQHTVSYSYSKEVWPTMHVNHTTFKHDIGVNHKIVIMRMLNRR